MRADNEKLKATLDEAHKKKSYLSAHVGRLTYQIGISRVMIDVEKRKLKVMAKDLHE